jgi:hypothetical protein
LFACKQGAHTGFVASLALEQSAVTAVLAGLVGGEFLGVDFAGISFVAQGASLGVGFGNHVSSHGKTASQQSRAASADLDHEFATTGHKKSPIKSYPEGTNKVLF